jgi:hypothetical protein
MDAVNAARRYELHNHAWHAAFALDDGLWLVSLTDRRAGLAWLSTPVRFCAGAEGKAEPVAVDDTRLEVAWPGMTLAITLDGPALVWTLKPVDPAAAPVVHLPALAALFAPAAGEDRVYLGAAAGTPWARPDGGPVWRHADFPLPAVRVADDGATITLLLDGLPPDLPLDRLWDPAGTPLGPGGSPAWEFRLVTHAGGWPAAFDLLRQRVRGRFDLSEYARPDLAWYGDQLVQHFTFLYGREILDLETGQFDLARFLDEGEELFGGYDGFLIWGVYPRIGVDERTQFDFYDDFPGGRTALREMARAARARGVRFFVPYKPWDRAADWRAHGPSAAALRQIHEHSQVPPELARAGEIRAWQEVARQDAQRLAQLVQDVEADGVFLDTMSAINAEFRAAIDRAQPGVVFCSEGRAKGPAFEIITGSWDQSANRSGPQGNWSAAPEPMPGVDLWRFVFPEHRLFVISRHAVGDDRLRITQRGFFNGMGWVVWQDIFGLVLTYAPAEAALLRKCATLLRQHRAALWSPQPTPLIDTLQPGVYANEFPAATKRLWTLYNGNDEAVGGPLGAPLLQITPRPGWHLVDIWHDEAVIPDAEGRITVRLEPRSVGAVVELPQHIVYDVAAGTLSLAAGVDAELRVTPLTGDAAALDAGRGAAIADLRAAAQTPLRVQAVHAGEVLDQLVI